MAGGNYSFEDLRSYEERLGTTEFARFVGESSRDYLTLNQKAREKTSFTEYLGRRLEESAPRDRVSRDLPLNVEGELPLEEECRVGLVAVLQSA